MTIKSKRLKDKNKNSNKRIKKKKLRKLLLIIFVIILAFSAIVGCNKLSAKSDETLKENIIPSDNGTTTDPENVNNSYIPKNEDPEPTIESNDYENNIENISSSSDALEVQEMLTSWNYLRDDGKKIAYLTFDDGPSKKVTPEILDVLEKNNIKATFFVVGKQIEENDYAKDNLKRIYNEGHAIGNHGYSHYYHLLYPNGIADPTAFMNDMNRSEGIMKGVLGDDFSTKIIRFPGGHNSWDTTALDPILADAGYSYIDWNSLTGDAEGSDKSSEELLSRLKECLIDLEYNDDTLIVLMHDTDAKQTTADSLQQVIDYLTSLGYEFRTLK